MAIIKSGATTDQLTIDPTSKAARMTPYHTDGTPLYDATLKAIRVSGRPIEALGFYSIAGNAAFTAVTANTALFSFRWSDVTKFGIILKVEVATTATAFTTAGNIERQMIICRSFTASDTGGTTLTPTGNDCKLRTSYSTSVVGDIRIGILTAGTRILDTNNIAEVAGYMSAVGNIISLTPLFDALNGNHPPLILAQDEGFIIRIGATDPASTRRMYVRILWAEATSY